MERDPAGWEIGAVGLSRGPARYIPPDGNLMDGRLGRVTLIHVKEGHQTLSTSRLRDMDILEVVYHFHILSLGMWIECLWGLFRWHE